MKSFGQSRFFSIYGFSFLTTCVLISVIGFTLGVHGLITMLALTALEITFSLDNAVVNAQVLEKMSYFWRRMFMTVGILIAVFGMRLVFPVAIVAVTAHLDIASVITLALNHPKDYALVLQTAHPTIAAFGGMFLLMIFLDYIFGEANMRFVAAVVRHLRIKGAERYLQILLAVGILASVCLLVPDAQRFGVMLAGLVGMTAFITVRALSDWFAASHAKHKETNKAFVRGGFVTFLYLEMLDASFSFDGVVGAFAVTSNVILIAAGLGAGAVWVRSITIDLVKNGTLKQYPYLDLGAHVAIGSLAVLLLLGIGYELPDLLAGSIGLGIILLSFFASVVHNRRAARVGA
jgi:uncharacterized protein